MSSLSLSPTTFYLRNVHSSKKPSPNLLRLPPLSCSFTSSSSLSHNFNFFGSVCEQVFKKKRGKSFISFQKLAPKQIFSERIAKSRTSSKRIGFRAVCYAAPMTVHNLQLISTISAVVLILARGTTVQKSFIVPLFALQAPAPVIAWMKGRYGLWSAFLALLVRLFFYIPGELELPFLALLLVIVAPYEVMKLRDTKEGAIISSLIAVYLAFQHFSRTSLQKSIDQGSIVATLAVICIAVASLLLLI